jgi:microcystin-dependent protein
MGAEPFIGEIILFAGNYAPAGWAFCNGQLLPISQNTALFSLLGTTYGGDGQTTFALPDLRGRTPIGSGSGPGLTSRALGERAGAETHTLTTAELPPHSHDLQLDLFGSSSPAHHRHPGDRVPGSTLDSAYSDATGLTPMAVEAIDGAALSAGGGQPHNNMPPFLGLNYLIALVGIFPPRP